MWTPRRVLLLSTGVAVFLAGFVVYSFFLGSFDGLPPLPQGLLAGTGGPTIGPPDSGLSDIDRKLQQAFGPQCTQINKSVKFEIRKKDLVVAADEASFKEPDGRVKLKDFNIALFKYHSDSKLLPEITTVTSNYAFLTFDQLIQNPTDMSKAKIVGGELRGKITIINNHRTAERFDDLEIFIENEPLLYDDKGGKIWTNGVVMIIDKQNKPHPNKISGKELEILLVKDDPKDKKSPAVGQAAKPKSDLNGVQSMTLKSMVEMHLYTDSGSGFMSSASVAPAQNEKKPNPIGKNPAFPSLPGPLNPSFLFEKPEVKVAAKAPEKSHIVITTFGSFSYDVPNDVARFDSPPAKKGPGFSDQVQVLREPVRDKSDPKVAINYDHLVCDHLELKFRPRAAQPGAAKGTSPDSNREIDSAHATARPGDEVVLALDSEFLDCHCQELIYHSATNDRGARTTLRGDPLCAVKDGHQLHARELVLEAANQKGANQRIFAQGPGQIDLCDRNPEKGFTTHAIWKGQLSSIKEKINEREITVLTFTKDAAFVDDERKGRLTGQTLVIRLEQVDSATKTPSFSPKQDPTTGGPRQQPTRVEAYEHVTADLPDLQIPECNTLKVNFRNQAKTEAIVSGVAQSPKSGSQLGVLTGQPATKSPAISSPADPKNKEPEKKKRPIDLRARTVDVDVLRVGEKHELQEVVATGNVRVRQEGEKPGDNGVDIRGHELNLRHFKEGEGDILVVYGDDKSPGQLLISDLRLFGPKVTIDQRQNTAAVDGVGVAQMPSNTTFQGGKPTKPTLITVHFTQNMFFDGRDAEFNGGRSGGVVAVQENSELQCQSLIVELDHSVSLKQGQKSGQAAKVEKVIAHYDTRDNNHWVAINDVTKDASDKVIKQSQMYCRELFVDHPINKVQGSGPGLVASLQYGSPEVAGSAKGPKQPKESVKPQQLMLTRVVYQENMTSTLLSPGNRKTNFWGRVDVIHSPAQSLDADVDPNKLPKGGMYLQCELLTVVSTQAPDGKAVQNLRGEKNVRLQTPEIRANAEVVTFDEASDQVIMKGSKGNLAVIQRLVGGPGSDTQPIRAETIMYNRKTTEITIGNATSLGGG